jgi:hypothetical protein
MGAEPVRSADYIPCPWTAGLPVDGSTAYLINTVAMFVVSTAYFLVCLVGVVLSVRLIF